MNQEQYRVSLANSKLNNILLFAIARRSHTISLRFQVCWRFPLPNPIRNGDRQSDNRPRDDKLI